VRHLSCRPPRAQSERPRQWLEAVRAAPAASRNEPSAVGRVARTRAACRETLLAEYMPADVSPAGSDSNAYQLVHHVRSCLDGAATGGRDAWRLVAFRVGCVGDSVCACPPRRSYTAKDLPRTTARGHGQPCPSGQRRRYPTPPKSARTTRTMIRIQAQVGIPVPPFSTASLAGHRSLDARFDLQLLLVPSFTSPRQAPLSTPLPSMRSLKRLRSPRTRRSSSPITDPTRSIPSGR